MADPLSRASISYGTAEVRSFVDAVHASQDAPLAAAFAAPGAHGFPEIQIGAAEGRLLELLARLHGARSGIELGTLTGFSAIHLARGMGPEGRLLTVENDPDHAAIARERIAAAGLSERIEIVEADAAEALADLASRLEDRGPLDLVFLDADKGRYDVYGRWAAEHLRPGGLLIADNAYFFGRLLEDGAEPAAMRRFHREAADRFETVCVPTPDGLLIGLAGRRPPRGGPGSA